MTLTLTVLPAWSCCRSSSNSVALVTMTVWPLMTNWFPSMASTTPTNSTAASSASGVSSASGWGVPSGVASASWVGVPGMGVVAISGVCSGVGVVTTCSTSRLASLIWRTCSTISARCVSGIWDAVVSSSLRCRFNRSAATGIWSTRPRASRTWISFRRSWANWASSSARFSGDRVKASCTCSTAMSMAYNGSPGAAASAARTVAAPPTKKVTIMAMNASTDMGRTSNLGMGIVVHFWRRRHRPKGTTHVHKRCVNPGRGSGCNSWARRRKAILPACARRGSRGGTSRKGSRRCWISRSSSSMVMSDLLLTGGSKNASRLGLTRRSI